MKNVPSEHIETLARAVVRLREEYEFRTFRLGVSLRGPITKEEAVATKQEVNRRVCLRVLELRPDLEPLLEQADAHIVLRYPQGTATIDPHALLIYGRYLKFSREIPHARWHCHRCRGRGCAACGGTGRRFLRTVEELVAKSLLERCDGTGSKFHSVGREDVDARMLGRGRPFILEILRPRTRTLDLESIQDEINRAYPDELEIREFQRADRKLLRIVNTISPDKSYRAIVTCLSPARREKVEALGEISDIVLAQETPRRVLHRRANKVRRRAVRNCAVEVLEADSGYVRAFALMLRVESGTYVKEFVSGDEGRTRPSVAQYLDAPCDCAALDVLEVHCDPLQNHRCPI